MSGQPSKVLLTTKLAGGDIDKIISTLVLANLWRQNTTDYVDVFILEKEMYKLGFDLVTLADQINFLEKLNTSGVEISLPRGEAKVKEVKWQETDTDIKIYVITETGGIASESYQLVNNANQYTNLITFGLARLPSLKEILGEMANFANTVNITNIDLHNDNEKFGRENYIYPNTKTYAEVIMQYVAELGWTITAADATALIAAIYWKTCGLASKHTNANTFTNLSKLLQLGGDLAKAHRQIFQARDLKEVLVFTELYQNLVITNDDIGISHLTKETAANWDIDKTIHPIKNPFGDVKRLKGSLILIPLTDNTTKVYGVMDNYKQVFNRYRPIGNERQFSFTVLDSLTETKNQLISHLVPKAKTPSAEKDKQPTETKTVPVDEPQQTETPAATTVTDPLAPATETITPDPAPPAEPPKPLFGDVAGGGGSGNPFGPI
jgi:hypothetical protein